MLCRQWVPCRRSFTGCGKPHTTLLGQMGGQPDCCRPALSIVLAFQDTSVVLPPFVQVKERMSPYGRSAMLFSLCG